MSVERPYNSRREFCSGVAVRSSLRQSSRGPTDSLANLVARTVGVAQLVGLVDDDEVPGNRLEFFA